MSHGFTDRQTALLRALATCEHCTLRALGDAIDVSHVTVQTELRRLLVRGAVRKPAARKAPYTLTDYGRYIAGLEVCPVNGDSNGQA